MSVKRVVAIALSVNATAILADPTMTIAQPTSDRVDYSKAIQQFERAVEREVQSGLLTGVSVALVDDQHIAYANGFGLADKTRNIPATTGTVYRAGSVSKLFTAIATMQLAEQGRIDIDAPITQYDPAFRIVNPFADSPPITLRQLMCHRSGLIRECPVGSYFDPTEPTIQQTVASIAPCVMAHRPDTVTKYSNLGVTVVGHIVQKVAGVDFVEYQRRNLLEPMGMSRSSFLSDDTVRDHLAKGYMRVADGRDGFFEIEAPHFELGTIPAGNLYSTAEDLGRFLMCLLAKGRSGNRQIIRSHTLAEMFEPQLTSEDSGFGLGFFVGRFRDHKTVSHNGAVYGFSTSVYAMPDEKLGVVVLANEDITGGPVKRIADLGLSLLLEAKLSEKPAAGPKTITLPRRQLQRMTGDFESESYWARLDLIDDQLRADISGQEFDLTPVGELRFLANGRRVYDAPIEFTATDDGRINEFSALGQSFHRVAEIRARETPAHWQNLLGSYGPEFIPLIVSIRHGHLYAMTENLADYRLTPVTSTVYRMPPGLYTDEYLIFHLDSSGRAQSVELANMPLPRLK